MKVLIIALLIVICISIYSDAHRESEVRGSEGRGSGGRETGGRESKGSSVVPSRPGGNKSRPGEKFKGKIN